MSYFVLPIMVFTILDKKKHNTKIFPLSSPFNAKMLIVINTFF